jgi:hypothetical protein
MRNPSVQRVELSFPLRADMAFLARMTVSAIASRADFGLDQIEDLRLAIDELCITIMKESRDRELGESVVPAHVGLSFQWTNSTINVTGRLVRQDIDRGPRRVRSDQTSHTELAMNELSERILDALVDEHGVDNRGGQPCMWFTVRRRARQ